MRLPTALLAAALAAAPAIAREPEPVDGALPPEVTDPATLDRLSAMVGPLSRALMNLPVGEIEAAAEGRPATAQDRRRTVRDVAGPNAEQDIQRGFESSRAAMQAGVQAMARALPALRKAVEEAHKEVERATVNVPQPGYPKR